MGRHSPLNDTALPRTAGLARGITSFAHSDGDYTTAILAIPATISRTDKYYDDYDRY